MDKAAVEGAARKAISPLKPLNIDIDFSGNRTDAGRNLPPYYLVYFPLVDLLGFRNLDREEKVA